MVPDGARTRTRLFSLITHATLEDFKCVQMCTRKLTSMRCKVKAFVNVMAFRKAGQMTSGEWVGHWCFNPSSVPQIQVHGGPGISWGPIWNPDLLGIHSTRFLRLRPSSSLDSPVPLRPGSEHRKKCSCMSLTMSGGSEIPRTFRSLEMANPTTILPSSWEPSPAPELTLLRSVQQLPPWTGILRWDSAPTLYLPRSWHQLEGSRWPQIPPDSSHQP